MAAKKSKPGRLEPVTEYDPYKPRRLMTIAQAQDADLLRSVVSAVPIGFTPDELVALGLAKKRIGNPR